MKFISIFTIAGFLAAGINAMPTANDALKARSAILERSVETDTYQASVEKREASPHHTIKRDAAPYHTIKREANAYHTVKREAAPHHTIKRRESDS